MKKIRNLQLAFAMAVVLAIAGVAYHSVGEIHYLKSFYPTAFSVQEVFYATLVEWIKFLFIAFPLLAAWLVLKGFFKE